MRRIALFVKVDGTNLQSDEYLCIQKPSEGFFKAKGSKFLAYAFPVVNQADIKKALTKVREIHPKARHHCYAWKLGLDDNNYRANDDGEPSGSAGRPIYGQIRSKNLSNVLVVVVRYFGGTLLGVPGLIEAYKKSTADALEQAQIITRQIQQRFIIRFTYAEMNVVMPAIKKINLTVVQKIFEESCAIEVEMRKGMVEGFTTQFSKMEGVKIEVC